MTLNQYVERVCRDIVLGVRAAGCCNLEAPIAVNFTIPKNELNTIGDLQFSVEVCPDTEMDIPD